MSIETALKAELDSAFAFNFLQIARLLKALTRELTRDIRAPLNGWVLVSEGLNQPLPVFVSILLISVEEPLED